MNSKQNHHRLHESDSLYGGVLEAAVAKRESELGVPICPKPIPTIVIASGENSVSLHADPQFSDADLILSEKIPATLKGLV